MAEYESLNGLLLPERIIKAKQEELRGLDRQDRNRFFANYAKQNRTRIGSLYEDTLLYGSAVGYGVQDKPVNTPPFSMLRAASKKSLIDRVIIDARLAQAKHVARQCVVPGRQIGFRVVHLRHADPDFKPDEEIQNRCREIEAIINNPAQHVHASFRDYLVAAVNEELTIDRKAMVLLPGPDGLPTSYYLLPGDTIHPVLQVLLPFMENNKIENPDTALDRMSQTLNMDLTSAEYVQIIDTQIVGAWKSGEMAVDITNPTVELNRIGYGDGSCLEKSLEASAMWLLGWDYNRSVFDVRYPEGLLVLYGDYNQTGLNAFEDQMRMQAGQASWNRLATIPGGPKNQAEGFGAEYVKLRDTPKDALFTELLRMIIQLKTASFRMHPSIINFSVDSGSGQALFNHQNAEQGIALSQEEGFHAIIEAQCDMLTAALVRPRYNDLVVIWDGLDKEAETERLNNLKLKVSSVMTVLEGRKAEGLITDPEDEEKFKYIDSPSFFQNQQMAQQAQMQQQQAAMGPNGPYEQGDFGNENAPDEEGDGEPDQPGQPFGGQQRPPQGGPPVSGGQQQGPPQNGGQRPPNNPFQKALNGLDRIIKVVIHK